MGNSDSHTGITGKARKTDGNVDDGRLIKVTLCFLGDDAEDGTSQEP
jgi:hypothetical protein